MSSAFISYASADKAIAREIATALRQDGISVWLDSEAIVSGAQWSDEIIRAIESVDGVVLLLSANSHRNKWVAREIELSIDRAKTVLPVLLDSAGKENWIWPLVSNRNALSLRDRSQIEALAKDIGRLIRTHDRSLAITQSPPRNPTSGAPDSADEVPPPVTTDTGGVDIELLINRDFDTFSKEAQDRLLEAINKLMAMGSEIRVVRQRK